MLFSNFYTPMQRVAARYVGTHTASDIVHDIFLSLWKNKFKADNILTMKAYLYNSVHNKCLNEIRKNKNNEKYLLSRPSDDFEEAIMDEEMFAKLLEAVDELPENYRKTIELSIEGESLIAIA